MRTSRFSAEQIADILNARGAGAWLTALGHMVAPLVPPPAYATTLPPTAAPTVSGRAGIPFRGCRTRSMDGSTGDGDNRRG